MSRGRCALHRPADEQQLHRFGSAIYNADRAATHAEHVWACTLADALDTAYTDALFEPSALLSLQAVDQRADISAKTRSTHTELPDMDARQMHALTGRTRHQRSDTFTTTGATDMQTSNTTREQLEQAKARVTLQALVALRFDVIAKSEDEFPEWFHPELEGLTFRDTIAILDAQIRHCRSELGVRPERITTGSGAEPGAEPCRP